MGGQQGLKILGLEPAVHGEALGERVLQLREQRAELEGVDGHRRLPSQLRSERMNWRSSGVRGSANSASDGPCSQILP